MFSFIECKSANSNIRYASPVELDLNIPGMPESPDKNGDLIQCDSLFPVFNYFINNEFSFSLLIIKFSYNRQIVISDS